MIRIFVSLALFFAATAGLRAQDVSFIVNPAGTDAAISTDGLKSVLLGNKTKWDAGGIIKLAVLTEGAAHEAVMKNHVQRTASQFDAYWKKQVFSGKGVMPAQFKTEAELLDYVAKTPGSVGYVGSGALDERVKALALQ